MRLVLEPTTLEQGSNVSRSITGVIYFDFDRLCFPEEGWHDFVVVISTWWLEALAKLERNAEHEVTLNFMDGPYWLTLTRQDGDEVRVRCIEDRAGDGVVHEERISLREFSGQLQAVARQVATACKQRGYESRDVDELRKYLPN